MSESLQPWIAQHLIAIAEDYGANTPSIPFYQNRKMVQLIEWLTFGNNDDSLLWANISDRQHYIPIRFSNKAIAEYNKLNIHRRITQQKTAIIRIKEFKPFFSRVPLGGGMKLSNQSVLAFDCDSITLVGSFDEARFGSPTEIESNRDLRLWSEGLRQDGGGGNVLKLRKDANKVAQVTAPPAKILPSKTAISAPVLKTGHPPNNTKAQSLVSNGHRKTNHTDPLRKREKLFPRFVREQAWRCSTMDDATIAAIPEEFGLNAQDTNTSDTGGGEAGDELHEHPSQHALDLDSPQQPPKLQSRESSPGIPITNWSPSPPPARLKLGSPPLAATRTAPVTRTPPVLSSDPTAPTPAQRRMGRLPPSSPPPFEVEIVASETVLLPATPLFGRDRYPVVRKVPRPLQPVPPRQLDSSFPQILVPNSDTSLSYSQSQPQSQSQPLTRDEVPESSQPVVLSQLSSLSKPQKHTGANTPHVEVVDVKAEKTKNVENDTRFSGSFNEDTPYDGDQSSLDHPNQELPQYVKQSHSNGHFFPADPPYSHNKEGLLGASVIFKPIGTQYQAEVRVASIDDDAPDATVQAPAHHHTGVPSLDHSDHETIDVILRLDEDDAQIHHELSNSRCSSQGLDFPWRHSSGAPGAEGDTRMPKTFVADKRVEDDDSLTRATGMIVNIVQHDADAWSAPSFLRHPSNTNTTTTKSASSSTNALPHALGQSNAANMKTDRRLKRSISQESSISRHRHLKPPADQNRDPTAPRAPRQRPKKLEQVAKETPLALASSTSQLNKRRKDTTSDSADPSPHAKKRRVGVEQKATINDPRAEKGHVTSLKAVEHGGRKLSGYTPNLSRIVLGDQPQPLVSWWHLRDILLKTKRDRKEGTRLWSA